MTQDRWDQDPLSTGEIWQIPRGWEDETPIQVKSARAGEGKAGPKGWAGGPLSEAEEVGEQRPAWELAPGREVYAVFQSVPSTHG